MELMRLIYLFIFLFAVSCTTHPHSKGKEEYEAKIQRFSAGDKQFAGLYHNFEFRSTILNEEITRSIHKRMEQFYDWSSTESSEKLNQSMADLESKTKIWLSFFTPDSKNDNLANKISIWKVYLKAGDRRFEGRVYKSNKNLDEAKALFPYHSRWATGYFVDFPVATQEISGERLSLLITGPLGRREVTFTP
jgi:hypothetical protein